MIQSFRNFFKSKVGIAVTLAFLGLIAFAFASADVAGTGSFGGVAGGDQVAMVGKDQISASDLSRSATSALERIKQEQPTSTMQSFLAQGGLDNTLDQLIDRYAIAGFGKQLGLRAGDRLVDSEIAGIAPFRGADGKFSPDLFKQMIRQQGLTEQMVREDIAQNLLARQVLLPVAFGTTVPDELVSRYAALLKETRKGAVAVLPSAAYAPVGTPTDSQIDAYYKVHRSEYTLPERRVIRFASFGQEALRTIPTPTEAEIAARYKRDAALYAATETRSFSQLVAPTEAAAKAILAEVKSGKSLQSVAASKGLATSPLANTTRTSLARDASPAVANAAFATARGQVSAPARGGLGWHLLQVEAVTATPGRNFEQARGEIAAALKAEKLRLAVADLGARIEAQIDDGGNLGEVTRGLGITALATKAVTADGKIFLSATETAPPVLARVLSTAFTMEEAKPQLTEIEPGKIFLVFDVSEIILSAPAPLKDIRAAVAIAYQLSEGSKLAKIAANRVLAKLAKGTDIAVALAAEKKPMPNPDRLNLTRDQLAAMGQRVPPALALFFSMAEGTVKRLEGPGNAGWFVVQLDDITPGAVAKGDPLLAQASGELGSLAGNEYEAQFRAAVRKEMGVERNRMAIDAVRRQLNGEN